MPPFEFHGSAEPKKIEDLHSEQKKIRIEVWCGSDCLMLRNYETWKNNKSFSIIIKITSE